MQKSIGCSADRMVLQFSFVEVFANAWDMVVGTSTRSNGMHTQAANTGTVYGYDERFRYEKLDNWAP